jgi:hypothetical protein
MGTFWLHYVGRHLYSLERFEREAGRYKVQRAVPFHMIKGFRWGDRILLAHWVKGSTEIFGYFTLESVVHNLPEDVGKRLLEKLDVDHVSSGPPSYERRFCGSYYVGGTAFIRDSVEELYEKAKKACGEAGFNPCEAKWFLKGRYVKLSTPILLTPAKFTRSYVKVELHDLDLDSVGDAGGALVWVYDYRRREYFRKGEEKLLEKTPPLDTLRGG